MDAELVEAKNRIKFLESVIAWANNSLFGSHGFFLTTNGGADDVHHLDRAIEGLKARNAVEESALEAADRLQLDCEALGGSGSPYVGPFNLPGYERVEPDYYRDVMLVVEALRGPKDSAQL